MRTARNINLDIIRFMAAFGILMTHIGGVGGIAKYTSVGSTCVKLFFILSGYLIFCSLEGSDIKEYFKKRVRSILPLYWTFLVCASFIDIVMLSGLFTDSFSAEHFLGLFRPQGRYSFRFLSYFAGLQMILPSSDWAVWNNRWNLWSISSFFLFYLIAPVLYKYLKSFKISLILLLSVLFVTRDFNVLFLKFAEKFPLLFTSETHMEWYASMNPYSELYCFLFGIVLYLAFKEHKEFHYLFLLTVILIFNNFSWFNYEITFTILTATMLISPSLLNAPKICSFITFLGSGSFSLYLWHPVILNLANELFPQDTLLKMLIIMTVSLLLSYTVYYIISLFLPRSKYTLCSLSGTDIKL